MIRSGKIDLARTGHCSAPLSTELQPAKAMTTVGRVSIRHYGDDFVSLATQSDGRRLLVLSDVDYPGWTATIDGRTAPIHQTDYAFRGVSVPAGDHVVEFGIGLRRCDMAPMRLPWASSCWDGFGTGHESRRAGINITLMPIPSLNTFNNPASHAATSRAIRVSWIILTVQNRATRESLSLPHSHRKCSNWCLRARRGSSRAS